MWLSVRIKRKRFVFNLMILFYFKGKPTAPLHHAGKTMKKHMLPWKNLWNERIWGNIYKMLNAWLRHCRGILAFKGKKGYKERDRKENAWRAVEQFLREFLWTIRGQAILWKAVLFFITFTKMFIINLITNTLKCSSLFSITHKLFFSFDLLRMIV